MSTIAELMTANPDAFKALPDVAKTLTDLTSVLKGLGHAVIIDDTKDPGYVPRSRLDEVNTQKATLKEKSDELAGQLEILKKAAKGNEGLEKQIADLQKVNTDWEAKYQQTSLDSGIKLAVAGKANDPADILSFLDRTKLALSEDGTVKGLDEAVTELQKTKPYLFVPITPPAGTTPPPAGTTPPAIPGIGGATNPPAPGGTTPDYMTMSKEAFATEMQKLGVRI